MEYDIEKNDKIFGTISYLGALVLIPLLVFGNKASEYLKFHINQGLKLFIAEIVIAIFKKFVHLLLQGILVDLVFTGIGVIEVILIIIGVMNVISNNMSPLPLVDVIPDLINNRPKGE